MEREGALLSVRDLRCGYGNATVLPGVSFDVHAGELFVMLGPNGVGKTTLFKTILGLLPALGGEVLFSGEPLEGKGGAAKRIAYVPQAHVPAFPFTVEEIVLMGRTPRISAFSTPSDADRELIKKTLDELGLLHLAKRPYTEVSGGERQLILVARALAQEPDVLVMDEPASSLDFGNQAKLLRLLTALKHERSLGVLMTTHNPDHALLVADSALLFTEGGCLHGPTSEILTESNLSRAYGTSVAIVGGNGVPASCTLKL